MAREIRIETVSYVHQNGETVPIEALTPEQQKSAATALKLALLRELFCGRAEFFPSEKEKP